MSNELWRGLAGRGGVALSQEQEDLLNRFLDLLEGGNQKMNLTRIVDRASAEVSHIGDALTLLPYLPSKPARIADVGSGGGVPGIPLAIARPDSQMILIEGNQERSCLSSPRPPRASAFLQRYRSCQRCVEDAGRDPALRESFDAVACRAS